MDKPEPEIIIIDYPNDSPIVAKNAYPDLKSLLRLFFVLLFYMAIGGLIAGIFILATQSFNSLLLKSFLNFLSYIITIMLTINYAIEKIEKQQLSAFNFSFNKIPAWLVPVIVISTLGLPVGLERVSGLIPMPASVQKLFEGLIKKDIFSVAAIVIAAPVLEEILCRGIVLNGLLKNYSPRKAILISAIFFGVIHLNPWQALPAFCGGLFLGWVFYKTKSVIPGMIIHATINAAASLFLFLPKHQQGFLSLLGRPYYIVLCVFSTLVFVSGCVIIQKKVLPIER